MECALLDGKLADFDLNVFSLETMDMCRLYLEMIRCMELQDTFGLPTETVITFAREVAARYQSNPYHCFYHGFSVAQFLYGCHAVCTSVQDMLTKLDLLSLFVAALVHDADHPGKNNDWEVKSRSPLAIRYADCAVLENHHAAVGRQILASSRSNMFASLTEKMLEEAKDLYTHAILQTDMAQHFAMVDRLKKLEESCEGSPFNRESALDRRHLAGVLMHSVDISNPLIPDFRICRQWAERINQEFVSQYEAEKSAGLKLTDMWKNNHTNIGFYKSQVGFVNFLVFPLWSTVTSIFPEFQAKGLLIDTLKSNKAKWQALADEEEAQEKAA